MTHHDHDDPQSGAADELLDLREASALLDVPSEQVRTMAEQGMLTPDGEGDDMRFRRGELIAARQTGG